MLKFEKAEEMFCILRFKSAESDFDKKRVVRLEFTRLREPFIIIMQELTFTFELNILSKTADALINDEFNVFSKEDAFKRLVFKSLHIVETFVQHAFKKP